MKTIFRLNSLIIHKVNQIEISSTPPPKQQKSDQTSVVRFISIQTNFDRDSTEREREREKLNNSRMNGAISSTYFDLRFDCSSCSDLSIIAMCSLLGFRKEKKIILLFKNYLCLHRSLFVIGIIF